MEKDQLIKIEKRKQKNKKYKKNRSFKNKSTCTLSQIYRRE